MIHDGSRRQRAAHAHEHRAGDQRLVGTDREPDRDAGALVHVGRAAREPGDLSHVLERGSSTIVAPIETGRQVRPTARRLTDAWRDLARALYAGPAGGNAVVVQRLLDTCPGVKLLVTSRTRLALADEWPELVPSREAKAARAAARALLNETPYRRELAARIGDSAIERMRLIENIHAEWGDVIAGDL